METTLYEVKLLDGRIFRVFAEEKNQKKRLNEKLLIFSDNLESISSTVIHTIEEFEKLT